ncbi:hypothetical protein [Lacticaseibacillus daqingensis]|uniref:hypothetical protein n=1 Tax=Lacticaseibacillus daqingensis TaxID=2486014 RepID=UPI000F767C1C|nr:hypothetical protein [Lacticaseibacillus daqingensis]
MKTKDLITKYEEIHDHLQDDYATAMAHGFMIEAAGLRARTDLLRMMIQDLQNEFRGSINN